MSDDYYIILYEDGYVTITNRGVILNSNNASLIGLILQEATRTCTLSCEKCLLEITKLSENSYIQLNCFSHSETFKIKKVQIEENTIYFLRIQKNRLVSKNTQDGNLHKSLVKNSGAFFARYIYGSFNVIYCNDRFVALTGKKENEILYHSIFELVPQDEREIVQASLESLSVSRETMSCEHSIIHTSNKSERCILWHFSAVKNDTSDDTIAAIDVCGMDISSTSFPKKKIISFFKEILSPQEYKVLLYSAHLNSRKATARILNIDEKTYDTYLDRTKKKISAKGNVLAIEIIKLLDSPNKS